MTAVPRPRVSALPLNRLRIARTDASLARVADVRGNARNVRADASGTKDPLEQDDVPCTVSESAAIPALASCERARYSPEWASSLGPVYGPHALVDSEAALADRSSMWRRAALRTVASDVLRSELLDAFARSLNGSVSNGPRLLREWHGREDSLDIPPVQPDVDATLRRNLSCLEQEQRPVTRADRRQSPAVRSASSADIKKPRRATDLDYVRQGLWWRRELQTAHSKCLDVVELAVVRKIRAWNATGPACAQERVPGDCHQTRCVQTYNVDLLERRT
ncbi:hypothetical protein OH77DRAFT_1525867 [Trametes cingulata]|nr:hypothetical protein OH77DRAFT_1525867 [Trametes cingulata]